MFRCFTAGCAWLLLSSGFIGVSATAQTAQDDLTQAVKSVRAETGAPAVGAVTVFPDGRVLTAVTGVRAEGGEARIALDDAWHMGSNSKAVTATLVLKLAEEGHLTLDTTVQDALGDTIEVIDPAWKDVTFRQLLSHRSGMKANAGIAALLAYGGLPETRDARADRLEIVANALAEPPANTPGSAFTYSNLGYVTAGAMIEAIMQAPYDKVLRKHVFEPLEMKHVVTGAPFGDAGTVAQGHRKGLLRPLVVVAPGEDNPAFMQPAGGMSYTLADYGRFLSDQLAGARGEPGTLLSPESYTLLATAPDDLNTYGLGWGLHENGALGHSGSNTMWLVVARVDPEANMAVAIVSNDGRIEAQSPVLSGAIDSLVARE